MHDRASANGAAMRTVKVIFPMVVDIGCYSHTLDVGEKFDLPVLDEFIRLWISLFPIVLVYEWNGGLGLVGQ